MVNGPVMVIIYVILLFFLHKVECKLSMYIWDDDETEQRNGRNELLFFLRDCMREEILLVP